MQRSVKGEVISSTFDESAERHIQVAEMVIEKAKAPCRARQGRSDPPGLHYPPGEGLQHRTPSSGRVLRRIGFKPLRGRKGFFGAAGHRRRREPDYHCTALVETGSRMDDVIFEEFKGTGNCEVYLGQEARGRRVFPAIDITRSEPGRKNSC